MGRLVKSYELDVGEYTGRIPVATSDTRPSYPEDGQILFNSTLNMVEVFRKGNWEQAAIVGNTTVGKDSFMGDGSSTTFSPLSYYYYPFDAKQVLVFVENVYQEPDVAYTLHENEIIFAEPIPNGLNIIILHGYSTVGLNPNTSQLQSLYIPLLTSLLPEISASQPMYTRANVATIIDHEGWVRQVAANEARFMGMRRVENLLTDSEDLNDVSWTKSNSGTGSVPVVTSGLTDPDGGSTAWRLQLDKGAGGTSGDYSYIKSNVTAIVDHDYTRSIWMKSNTGGNQIVRLRSDIAPTLDVEVTTDWQRFSITCTATVADTNQASMEVLTRGDLVTTQSVDILIWHPQVEDVTGQTNQAPGDYISAQVLSWPYHGAGVDRVKYFDTDNGNFVSNVYVTEQTGNVIISNTFQGMKVEPERENLLLYSEDFTNVLWANNTATLVTVAANAVVSPDGTLSGTTITQNSGAANDGKYQLVTLSLSTTYSLSCFLQAGTSSLVRVGSYNPASVAWNGYIDITFTGNVPSTNASFGAANILYEEQRDGWYRASFNFTSDATNASHTIQFHPDRNNTGGSFSTWGYQLELGDILTSRIPTLNTTIIRGQDLYTIDAADNIYDDQGTAYAEYIYAHTNVQGNDSRILGGVASSGTPIWFDADTTPALGYDGANQTATPTVTAIPANNKIQGACSWNSSLGVMKSAASSTVGDLTTYDSSWAISTLSIGYGSGSVEQFAGTIRNVRIWTKYLLDDKLALVVGHPFALLIEDGSLLLLQDGNYVLLN